MKNGREMVERKKWFVVGYDYATLASALVRECSITPDEVGLCERKYD